MKHEGPEFIQRLLEGDPEAAKWFYAHYGLLVKSKALAAGLPLEDAEEISQETLIRVLKSVQAKKGLDEPRKLGAFVHGTARNVIAEFRRDSLKRFPVMGGADRGQDAADCSVDSSPEHRLWKEEFQQRCDQVLSSLRPRYGEFLSDRYIQGLDTKALCRKWGIEPVNCRVLHHRALKAFAKKAKEMSILDELLDMLRNKPG